MKKKQAVQLINVSKKYNLLKSRNDKLKNMFFNKQTDTFWALRNVNLTIYQGETIGLVGINGAGKSTLSNVISESIIPTHGEVLINGEVSLLAIKVGLKNALSGVENIKLKLLMHGLNPKQIQELLPSIIEFADIGTFIDQPIKNYSSGMRSRLGFAICVHLDPDILIIDEALSVGDQTFYQKCVDRIDELKNSGKTIIFVSHSLAQVKKLCDRIVWMHYGEVRAFGEAQQIAKDYDAFIKEYKAMPKKERKAYIAAYREEQKQDTHILVDEKETEKKHKPITNILLGILLVEYLLFFGGLVVTDTSLSGLIKSWGKHTPATSQQSPKKIDQADKK